MIAEMFILEFFTRLQNDDNVFLFIIQQQSDGSYTNSVKYRL